MSEAITEPETEMLTVDPEAPEHAPDVVAPLPRTVGGRLRAAREAKGLTVTEAAQALKLGARQVEAVEADNWGDLPGVTFIRGFVRNYARLVQIDAAPLMDELNGVLNIPKPELAVPDIHASMPEPAGRSQRRDSVMVAAGALLLLFAVLTYFFMPDDLVKVRDALQSLLATHTRPAENPAPAAGAEPVLPPGSSIGQVINPQAMVPAGETPAAAAPERPATAVAPADQGAAAAPGPTSAAVKLSFLKEAWVEVRDRRGNVVFSQRGDAGTEREVEGETPLALVVGYVPGVRVAFRGQPVDLAPHSRGDVARLMLE